MTDREKLAGLIGKGRWMCSDICSSYDDCDLCNYSEDGSDCHNTIIADHLIANGVVIQKRGWTKVYQNAMYPYSCSECGNCHARKVNFCERCGTKLDLPQPPKGE